MVFATGDLKKRIDRNILRLKSNEYRSPDVFGLGLDWPGDWQGRDLLALCAQYRSTGDSSVLGQASEIVRELPFRINRDGYMGELLDYSCVNEQQLSGNSWLVRGLCAYYRITEDGQTHEMLQRYGENFFLPLLPCYRDYTVSEAFEGGVSGHVSESADGGWKHSSDIGCAFILLDGLTDLCEVLRDEKLIGLAKIIAEKFLSIDYVAVRFQTHAMLSATRGVLRLFRLTGDESYLAYAKNNFSLYAECGTTVNYANQNWFGRRDSWTEPCGFIDSFMLATELYKATGNTGYLRFADRVYLNAFRSAQRKNGGAGCETCLTKDGNQMRVHIYEAFFCCTMRYADGLDYVRDNAITEKEKGKFAALSTVGGRWESEDCAFEYTFDGLRGKAVIEVGRGKVEEIDLYLPENVHAEGNDCVREKDGMLICGPLPEGRHVFTLRTQIAEKTVDGVKARYFADYLLTEKEYEDSSPVQMEIDGRIFSPLEDCISVEERLGISAYLQKI